MIVYKCDICGKEVEYGSMLDQFWAYNPVTQAVERRDHCPSCLRRALSILTMMAITRQPDLEFDRDTTIGELIADMGDALRAEAFDHIADRWTTFKAVFTRDPTQILPKSYSNPTQTLPKPYPNPTQTPKEGEE